MLSQKTVSTLTGVVLFSLLCFFIFEIANDIFEGESVFHLLIEIFFFVLAFIVMVIHVRVAHEVKTELAEMEKREKISTYEPSKVIQQQLETWKMTAAEVEVSWLILKGFSFIEIAHLRSVKEKTIRAQATNIYKKSGTGNRNDFAARFMDELLNYR